MALPQATIKDWTAAFLTRFIRDLFINQPPGFLPNLRAEKVTVTQKLVIADELEVTREPTFRSIGGTGQPAFTNSWTNFGAGWQAAQFWRDPLGWVHLRGIIKSGVVGSAAFTLPPGYRPIGNETYVVRSNGTTGGLDVLADGTVTPQSPSNNTYVSLSGIQFRTT